MICCRYFFISLILFVFPVQAYSGVRTVFEGKIIRALSIDAFTPGRILVGLKGRTAGTALVIESRDDGTTWHTLNHGTSLSAEATDVQAVAALGEEVIVAGSWQHGLFISFDRGRLFSKVIDFPSTDIRGFVVRREGGSRVLYAATARDGVWRSADLAKTWQALGPGKDFFWSISHASAAEAVFAASLEQAVYRRLKGKWTKIFDRDNIYAVASDKSGRVLALAGENGGYLSTDGGDTWKTVKALKGEKLSSVIYNAGQFIFGSWSNGVVRLTPDSAKIERFLSGNKVVHVAVANGKLFLGTWGKGLKIMPYPTEKP